MWFAGPARRSGGTGGGGGLRLGLHLERGMRVGLFGGSFDPAHPGHAHVAETALLRLGLDRVVWLVSPQNPLKGRAGSRPLAQRLAGAARQARGPRMIVSDAEARLGVRFTVDTVRALKARHPGVRFVWLMGADNLASFHRWRGWTDIMAEVPVAVVARPGSLRNARFAPAARRFARDRWPSRRGRLLPGAAAPAWMVLRAPLNPESSTRLRAAEAAAGSSMAAAARV